MQTEVVLWLTLYGNRHTLGSNPHVCLFDDGVRHDEEEFLKCYQIHAYHDVSLNK